MSTPLSIACQLLSASCCAYNIDTSNYTYAPPAGDPYGPHIGWTLSSKTAPLVIVRGATHEYAALVGLIDLTIGGTPTTSIVVAFEGTVPSSPSGWVTDFLSTPAAFSTVNVPGSSTIQGLGHSGFLNGLKDMMNGVLFDKTTLQTMIASLQNSTTPYPIYITGHSKGAGMASLFAALLAADTTAGMVPAGVYTFASPMVGNADFVAGFPTTIPVYRYENYLDIVPFLSPSPDFITTLTAAAESGSHPTELILFLSAISATGDANGGWGYVPVGELTFIDSSDALQSPPSATNNSASFIAALLATGTAGIQTVLNAHSHTCGNTGVSSYMGGTCANMDVCPIAS